LKINNLELPNSAIDSSIQKLVEEVVTKYSQLDFNKKLAIKTLVRTFAVPIISNALEVPLPHKEEDPVVWLMAMGMIIVKELYEHIEIISTSNNNSITSINISISDTSESGRQLVASWQEG